MATIIFVINCNGSTINAICCRITSSDDLERREKRKKKKKDWKHAVVVKSNLGYMNSPSATEESQGKPQDSWYTDRD